MTNNPNWTPLTAPQVAKIHRGLNTLVHRLTHQQEGRSDG